MAMLNLVHSSWSEVAAFPFIDPPDRRQISDGVALLHELGAPSRSCRWTPGWRGWW
jgi:ATP-dependent helicase HrpA